MLIVLKINLQILKTTSFRLLVKALSVLSHPISENVVSWSGCHELKPSRLELGVHSTSVCVILDPKIITLWLIAIITDITEMVVTILLNELITVSSLTF